VSGTGAPHCDEFTNGFPRRCPTPEGALATTDPFANDDYLPIGIVNRFDLAPANGANCGQYRIIFAKKMAQPSEKLHIIFEAALANPHPENGLAACRAVAQFWAGLSAIDSLAERRAKLEAFFFTGIDGFGPVLDPVSYAPESSGGIRTLHDTVAPGVTDRFYQFHLTKQCTSAGCALVAVPGVLENMPFAALFDGNVDTPAARAFRAEFVRQVPTLAVRDVNLYFLSVSREYLMAESNPDTGNALAFDYGVAFRNGLATPAGRAFHDDLAAELRKIGSTLTPNDMILRAETQTCVGCHLVSGPVGEGVVFPQPLGANQHVDEHLTDRGPDGPFFRISPAMRDVFIPHRMKILREFLVNGTAPVHSN
jgi:hypothetical protein